MIKFFRNIAKKKIYKILRAYHFVGQGAFPIFKF